LVVFAATRPAPAPAPVSAPTATVNTTDIEQRVQAAVDKAAQAIEARYDAKTTQLVNSIRQKDLRERRLMAASFDVQSGYLERRLQGSERELRSLKGQEAQLRGVGEEKQ
jgi:hypothetical protein